MAESREDVETAEAARLLDPDATGAAGDEAVEESSRINDSNSDSSNGGVAGSTAGVALSATAGSGGAGGRVLGGSGRSGVRGKASTGGSGGEGSYFECNICLDGVREPVVTRCGHLFCWPCLFRWLNTNQTECPVCKAGVTATNVIPLYGRGADNVDPRTKSTGRDGVPSRPDAERPRAERPRVPNPFAGGFGMGAGWGGFPGMDGVAPGAGGMAGGQVQFQAGLGFFPSLFGLQFQSFTFPARPANATPAGGQPAGATEAGGANEGGGQGEGMGGAGTGGGEGTAGPGMVTAEDAQQAFLSRLLLMLGSLVILCLVLF